MYCDYRDKYLFLRIEIFLFLTPYDTTVLVKFANKKIKPIANENDKSNFHAISIVYHQSSTYLTFRKGHKLITNLYIVSNL